MTDNRKYYAALALLILTLVMLAWALDAGRVSLGDVMGAGVEAVEVEAGR